MKVSQDLKNKMQFLFYEKAAIENKKKQYYTELGEVWEQFLKENGLDGDVKYTERGNENIDGKLCWIGGTYNALMFVESNPKERAYAIEPEIVELEHQMQYVLENYVPIHSKKE
ncbi:MAG: hypothetical protein IJK26_10345 [Clostridia bacterium]|nr:hypothetical protein [Clostridia bacterium]